MTTSVTRRSTFAALSSDGRRVSHGPVRLRVLGADHPEVQAGTSLSLAFAFGRRFGSAVERNRAKRRLVAAFRDAGADSHCGAVLVSGTRQILTRPYLDLVADVRRCLDDLGRPSSVDGTAVDRTAVDRTAVGRTAAERREPGRLAADHLDSDDSFANCLDTVKLPVVAPVALADPLTPPVVP